jgi:adenosylcobinamide-GDP ribazoletransferase
MKQLLYALRFLTIIPIPYKQDEDMVQVGRSLSCFPFVGLFIGILLWGMTRLALLVFSPLTAGFTVMILSLIVTGGLHLDGLSDLADGLGGGRDREQKLEIMKDSRIGAFGALSLIGFLLLKGLFLMELIQGSSPSILIFLILPPLWARGIAVVLIKIFPPARPGGMGDFFRKNARTTDVLIALAITIGLTLLTSYFTAIYYLPLLIPFLLLLMLIPSALISRILGGLTGDCYGALIEGAELGGIFLLILGKVLL